MLVSDFFLFSAIIHIFDFKKDHFFCYSYLKNINVKYGQKQMTMCVKLKLNKIQGVQIISVASESSARV